MATGRVIDDPVLARVRQGLDAVYGSRLERVVLFGSRARGDSHGRYRPVKRVLFDEPYPHGGFNVTTGQRVSGMLLDYDRRWRRPRSGQEPDQAGGVR
jgi:hypothetical protein